MTATQTLAKELGPDGIRVNSVVPGYIWSDKMEAYFRTSRSEQRRSYEEVHAEVAARTALNHIPDSAEIADAVLFFASDLSRGVHRTGARRERRALLPLGGNRLRGRAGVRRARGCGSGCELRPIGRVAAGVPGASVLPEAASLPGPSHPPGWRLPVGP